MSFELFAADGAARAGRLSVPHGPIDTPAFMPVGTYGAVKGMRPAAARRSAGALDVGGLRLLAWRLSCDGGVLDFDLLATDKALLGLDGVVWRLQRRVARPSPEAAVRDLLHLHFISDMGLSLIHI